MAVVYAVAHCAVAFDALVFAYTVYLRDEAVSVG
jgi:hypothetical protein